MSAVTRNLRGGAKNPVLRPEKGAVMQVSSKWVVEPVEVTEEVPIPPMLLWKRTLLLAAIGIGIGLGAGYFLGRGMLNKTDSSDSDKPPVVRVRFMPLPDAEPAEREAINERLPARMPPAADSPADLSAQDSPPRGQARPAFLQLENQASRQADG
jgi:hypothetical protein